MKSRFVILHYHLFKNAGCTVDWTLERNFQGAFSHLEATAEAEFVTNEDILQFLSGHPDQKALSSHTFALPVPVHPAYRFVEICFVRHPLDRLQSMYYHYTRSDTPEELRSRKARELSLGEFLDWFVEEQPFNTINSQVCIFAKGGDYYYPPSEADLNTATARLTATKFLGVVERTDESCVAAEFFLRPMFPGLDLSYVTQNVYGGRKATLRERLAEMKRLCGRERFDELQKLNRLDEQLWSCANQELDRRLGHIPALNQKLADFQKRCKDLSNGSQ